MSERVLLAKRIENLHIAAKERVASFLSGNRRSLFLGNGNEFADLREYRLGDEIRYIDWRQSAKRHNSLIVRDFEVERNANIVFLLDASASMMLSNAERVKSAVIAIASLAHATIKNKDFFGLGIFSESLQQFLPPRGGKLHEHLIYERLLNVVPEGKTSIGESLKQVASTLKRRSVIMVLSDLHDAPEEMLRGFRIARAFNHEVQVIQFANVGEYTLPENVGKIKFRHPETNQPTVADFSDPIVLGKYTYAIREAERKVSDFKRRLRGLRVNVVSAYTGELTESILLSYFTSKQRGMRQ